MSFGHMKHKYSEHRVISPNVIWTYETQIFRTSSYSPKCHLDIWNTNIQNIELFPPNVIWTYETQIFRTSSYSPKCHLDIWNTNIQNIELFPQMSFGHMKHKYSEHRVIPPNVIWTYETQIFRTSSYSPKCHLDIWNTNIQNIELFPPNVIWTYETQIFRTSSYSPKCHLDIWNTNIQNIELFPQMSFGHMKHKYSEHRVIPPNVIWTYETQIFRTSSYSPKCHLDIWNTNIQNIELFPQMSFGHMKHKYSEHRVIPPNVIWTYETQIFRTSSYSPKCHLDIWNTNIQNIELFPQMSFGHMKHKYSEHRVISPNVIWTYETQIFRTSSYFPKCHLDIWNTNIQNIELFPPNVIWTYETQIFRTSSYSPNVIWTYETQIFRTSSLADNCAFLFTSQNFENFIEPLAHFMTDGRLNTCLIDPHAEITTPTYPNLLLYFNTPEVNKIFPHLGWVCFR